MDEQEGLRLVNSVFTTLYTPFYLAHQKYVKYLGQVQGSRVLDLSPRFFYYIINFFNYNIKVKILYLEKSIFFKKKLLILLVLKK